MASARQASYVKHEFDCLWFRARVKVKVVDSFRVLVRVEIRGYVKSFCLAEKSLKPKKRNNFWASEVVRAKYITISIS